MFGERETLISVDTARDFRTSGCRALTKFSECFSRTVRLKSDELHSDITLCQWERFEKRNKALEPHANFRLVRPLNGLSVRVIEETSKFKGTFGLQNSEGGSEERLEIQ